MNRIRQLRKKNNITQEKLGQLIGVQSSAISKYEKEIVPLTDDTIKKLSKIFNVTADYLICNDIKLENDIEEKEVLKNVLRKNGFMKNNDDLTDKELERLMKFINNNKEFLKEEK